MMPGARSAGALPIALIASPQELVMFAPNILVTSQDLDRLAALLDAMPPARRETVCALEAELERAEVVAPHAIPGDVVTMNSRVVFEDRESGKRSEAMLVYPGHADPSEGKLSVLAPVGSALLGLRVGEEIAWLLPSKRRKHYRLIEVVYQPEAAGDFHL